MTYEEAQSLIRSTVDSYKETGVKFDKKHLRYNEMSAFLVLNGDSVLYQLIDSCIPGSTMYIKEKPLWIEDWSSGSLNKTLSKYQPV